MGKKEERDEIFQTSHLNILMSFTLFSAVLAVEDILLGWEIWMLILIGLCVILSWILHIRQTGSDQQRTWVYASLMMGTFFFYGTHLTSTFDLAVVMAAVITLFIITRMKGLITMAQATYYITMLYCVVMMYVEKEPFDVLAVSRILLHFAIISMVGWFARTIIDKWNQVLEKSEDEIEILKDSTERLNDFLANVSHELRTPVNAVVGLTGICIDKEKNEEIRKDMIAVRSAGHKVAEQIGDILDYSEIDRGNLVKNEEDYMLSSVMHDLVTELREYKHDGVELVINVDPATPAVMNTDVTKLKKILKALVSNGLKYTREGGVYVKIKGDKHEYGVNLCIEVSDTGIGMSQEELERVFDRFYQANSGRNRSGSGLGLGLGIVSGFVALLGGFMTVDSTVGKGTTIRVSLPQKVISEKSCMSVENPDNLCIAAFLQFDKYPNPVVREYYNASIFNIVKGLGVQMHRVDNALNLEKLRETVSITHLFIGEEEYVANRELIQKMEPEMVVVVVANPGFELPKNACAKIMEKPFYCFPVVSVLNMSRERLNAPEGRMMVQGLRVLVVDDEPMNLVVGKSIFKRYGMEVFTAASGQESIQACREETFGLIFMDHMMAGMDGVEALKRIRADVSGLNKNSPVIALTANAMSSAKQMFLSEGFDGFVSKPIETEELERTLKKVLPKSAITYVEEEEEPAAEGMPEAAGGATGNRTEPGDKENFSPGKGEGNTAVTMHGKLREGNFDVEKALGYCAGDFEFYKMLLRQFAEEADEKIVKLTSFLENGDLKNYEILIHSIKSNAKTIGCMDFSDRAFEMEKAAKDGNEKYIADNHDEVMEEFAGIRDVVVDALGLEIPKAGSPAGGGKVPGSASSSSASEEVLEFGPAGGGEVLEFGPSGGDVMEFAPSSSASEEVLEFASSGGSEALEFAPSGGSGALEFGPAGSDEVLEFGPKGGNA